MPLRKLGTFLCSLYAFVIVLCKGNLRKKFVAQKNHLEWFVAASMYKICLQIKVANWTLGIYSLLTFFVQNVIQVGR